MVQAEVDESDGDALKPFFLLQESRLMGENWPNSRILKMGLKLEH